MIGASSGADGVGSCMRSGVEVFSCVGGLELEKLAVGRRSSYMNSEETCRPEVNTWARSFRGRRYIMPQAANCLRTRKCNRLKGDWSA